ncbi:MAG: hypothetical protein LBT55_07390 [Clostridiaceae bacterium]|jgi:hypothetical protein|nr:hypothetical protein [Clostridiaceae bacterium]
MRKTIIDLVYRADGSLERVQNGSGVDRLFQGAVGNAEYRLTVENAVGKKIAAADTVFIVLKRVFQGETQANRQRMTYAGEKKWVYISNGWETDTNAADGSGVEVNFSARKPVPGGGNRYAETKASVPVFVPVEAEPAWTYKGILPEIGFVTSGGEEASSDMENRISALESELAGIGEIMTELIGIGEEEI